MSLRNVCVVTGTRADYGALRPVCTALKGAARGKRSQRLSQGGKCNLQLHVCVTGMHLLPDFGMTARVVEADGWVRTSRVKMQIQVDSPAEQALALGRGVSGMTKVFQDCGIEVVVVLGDRIEALAGALAGSLSGLVVAHIHGGEVATGQQDDAIRHAISKLAHLHLVATKEAADRLVRMGEDKWRIVRVGAPALDVLCQMEIPPQAWVEDLLGMPTPDGFVIVAQHPVNVDAAVEKRHMRQTLQAVADAGLPALVIWPNSDPGHSGIINAIDDPPVGLSAKVVRSLPHEDYLKALLAARAIVGNSSSGIIEAPAAGTPGVNIGPRQAGRLQDRTSTLNCGYGRNPVAKAIEAALRKAPPRPCAPADTTGDNPPPPRKQSRRPTPYGDGHASTRIAEAIRSLEIDQRLLRKQNSY